MLRTSLNNEAPPTTAATTTLDRLGAGDEGRVAAIQGARLFRRRLLELGLLPGTRVRVVRLAALNGLIEVEARGSVVSLRLTDAGDIAIAEASSARGGRR